MIANHRVDTGDSIHVWMWEMGQQCRRDGVTDKSATRRQLLACTYGGAIGDWVIKKDHRGKPLVTGPADAQHISISAARTGNIEVFACSHNGELGVDVETLTHSTDQLHYVSRTFSLDEQNVLELQADKDASIIDLWTLKEAYGKAVGVGVDISERQHRFDLTKRPRPRLYIENVPSCDCSRWQFRLCSPRSDLRLATAINPEGEQQIPVRVQWIEADHVFSPPILEAGQHEGIHSW